MAHSIFHGRWSWDKFKRTPVKNIWPTMLLCALWALLVWVIEEKTNASLQLPNAFLSGTVGTILAFSIGLLTNAASAQYNDGRKLWCSLQTAATQLSHSFWFHIVEKRDPTGRPVPYDVPTDADLHKRIVDAKLEKKSMINLIQAYTVAIKHALRGEPGAYYADLYPLVAWLPHFAGASHVQANESDWMPIWASSRDIQFEGKRPAMPMHNQYSSLRSAMPRLGEGRRDSDTTLNDGDLGRLNLSGRSKQVDIESILPSIESECPIQPARRVKKTTWSDHIPVLLLGSWISRKFGGRGPSAHELEREYEAIMKRTPSNVPLEILNHLHQYVDDCLAAGIIRAPYDGMVAGDLVALLSAGNELRRIRSTPLPFAYQVHLRLAAWLYFIFFPVTMYETLKWAMVFAVIVLSFIYFGLLDIARDLENPFGYDANDLDMDGFCYQIQNELAIITTHDAATNASRHVYSSYNKPLAPADGRTAKELSRANEYHQLSIGAHQLQRTLLANWRAVQANVHAHARERYEAGRSN